MSNQVSREEYEQLQSELKNVEDKLSVMTGNCKGLSKENKQMKISEDAYRDTFSELTKQKSEYLKLVDKLESDLSCKQEQVEGRQESINYLQEKFKVLETVGSKEQQNIIAYLQESLIQEREENEQLTVVNEALIKSAVEHRFGGTSSGND
jgi:chromosome segregation ATPase